MEAGMNDPSTLMRTPATGPPPRTGARPPVVERIAGWSARHRAIALVGWLLLVAGAVVIGNTLGTKSLNSYDPGEAGRAERVLSSPGVALERIPRVATNVRSPLAPGGTALAPGGHGLISHDGRSALVTFDVAGNVDNAGQTVAGAERAVAAVQAAHPGLRIAEAGEASVDRAINHVVGDDFRHAEVTSVPVTLVLLLVVFGALIAAGIPLLLAGTAVATAISLLAIPSRWLPIGSTTSSVVLLVGMAVGVDYSLFYLRREREERAAGADTYTAVRKAAATSGRAIVVSGLTVMISLAGLFLTGIDVFSGLAVGTIMVVGITVLGSLTALPAALSLLGTWVDRGRIPFLGRRRTAARRSRAWEALARRVVAKPVLIGGAAAVVLVALAAPALGMRLANPGFRDLPTNIPVVQNLLATQRAFPGGPAPAEVVVTGHDLSGPAVRHAVAAIAERAATSPALREPVTTSLLGHGQVLVVSVPLAGAGTDTQSNHALATLRDQVLPATLGKVSGVDYAVTGMTAGNRDFAAQLSGAMPLVFVFVLGLAFLVLMVTFRSMFIPLMSIALNLLSIGAAYGVVTWIFQDGHLHGPLGFSPFGAIVPWMPLFMFVLLFGLSMDYHVFILSRIRELRLRGVPTKEAITSGIGASAGVVTSAAVIMVSVFSIFATLSVIEFKMIGIGLATAILIDATVVRGVLMPAAMSLLGERNWYLPRWLTWLPGGRGRHSAAAIASSPIMAM